jgi:hypothetical protein
MLPIANENKAFDLQANSFEQAIKFAEYIAKSSMVPSNYKNKPEDILIAIQWGQELGLKPLQALQNIATINGRPSIWGDAMLGIVQAHTDFESIEEYIKNDIAYTIIKRRNQPAHTSTFSMEDAKKAGLNTKTGPWTQYPNRMLQMRARGFALRNTFADALKGIISREEAEDYPNMQVIDVTNQKVDNIKQLVKNNNSSQSVAIQKKPEFEPEFEETKNIDSEQFEEFKQKILKAPTIIDLRAIKETIKVKFNGTEDQKQTLRDQYQIRVDEFKTSYESQ